MIARRNLEPQDFPFTIIVWRPGEQQRRHWLWAVTVLKPPPGTLVPIWVPPQEAPSWVTTRTGEGVVTTTGPYQTDRS